ncbi:MAG: IspD/TarI family cytidylyltransferase [Angustibacter sp.]
MAAKNVAVLLAGGVGSRLGATIPKQLLEIRGKSIIEYSIAAFQENIHIDEILVLMAAGYLEEVTEIVAQGPYSKVAQVLVGGKTRSETTAIALDHLAGADGNVLFHDAVRPLISQDIICRCVAALTTYQAVATAIPSVDTIVQVREPRIDEPDALPTLTSTLPRQVLRRQQTPQGFRLSTIRQAYALARQDPEFYATDDCSVVVQYLPHIPVAVVAGDDMNLKITRPQDIRLAESLLRRSAQG